MGADERTSSDGLPPREDGPQVLRRLLHALPTRPQEPLHARVVAVLRLLAAMAGRPENKLIRGGNEQRQRCMYEKESC